MIPFASNLITLTRTAANYAPENAAFRHALSSHQVDSLEDEEIIERELTQMVQPWDDQVYQLLQKESLKF